MKISIINQQNSIRINPRKIKKIILGVLSKCNIKRRTEITVIFVNDKQIKELNLMFCGRAMPTDVLSFDSSKNKKELLADIAVSVDIAKKNAVLYATTPAYELNLYVVHGILHLLGYDDKTEALRAKMQKKAESLISH